MSDRTESKFHKVKGKFKEMTVRITGNTKLEVKGKVEKVAGKVREKIGQIKTVFGK